MNHEYVKPRMNTNKHNFLKYEFRKSKYETNSNYQNSNVQNECEHKKGKKLKKVIFALIVTTMILSMACAMEVQINLEYGKAGDEALLLDIYGPKGEGFFPGVVIVHGGGWSSGDKRADITSLFEPIADSNIVCYAINYRLAPKNHWPACYEDVLTAIKWVRANALKHKTDPNRIGIVGYSAGGQLALLAALKANKETSLKAAVGLAVPSDLVLDSLRRGNVSSYLQNLFGNPAMDANVLQTIWDSSPINHIKTREMPILLVHGTNDNSVPYQQSLNFKKRIEDANDVCELITINGAPHKITEWNNFDNAYQKKIAEWLKKQLK